MSDDPLTPEPERPRFLLPAGCKDLIDALRRQQIPAHAPVTVPLPDGPLPCVVTRPDMIRLRDLAAALRLKPDQLAALLRQDISVPPNLILGFATASEICGAYGVTPKPSWSQRRRSRQRGGISRQ
jgi:hypothetical protein